MLLALREEHPEIRIVKFSKNYGQTAALAAGFEVSRGEIVVTLDGDLQNDPADIPRLLEVLEEGHDIVAGWRKKRHDGFILRRLPSIVANRLISFVTGVAIHDTGCTLKAFRGELVRRLELYAERHRFLPVISHSSGARVTEVVVNHRPRRFGQSKYGIGRALRVLVDLVVRMLTQFSQKPMRYFGGLSLLCLAACVLFFLLALVRGSDQAAGSVTAAAQAAADERLTHGEENAVVVTMLIFMVTVFFAAMGLLAELAIKASDMHRRGTLSRLLNELH